jgi:hypothetical protein
MDPRNVKRRLDRVLAKKICTVCTQYSRPGNQCEHCNEVMNPNDPGFNHFRVHDLRHLCASLLLAEGTPLKVVSEILGHSRIGVTADIYAHVLPCLKQQATDLMESILVASN